MGKCRTPGYTVRTSKFGPRPPRVRTGPLEWDPDPPRMGSGPPTVGSQGSKTEHTRALIRALVGSGADTCPDLSAYTPAPRSGGDPMLPHGIIRVA
jgi:hypothetical protein